MSTEIRKRQLAVAVVAVLQFSRSYSHTLKIFLYLYINIELIFDFHTTYFGTATLQQRAGTVFHLKIWKYREKFLYLHTKEIVIRYTDEVADRNIKLIEAL